MKSFTKKLFALIFLAFIILSDVSSTFAKRRGKTMTSNKYIPEGIKGFLLGFFFEISKNIKTKNFVVCAFHGFAVNIYDDNIKFILEKMIIPENYDVRMNERSNAGLQMRIHKSTEVTLISSLKFEKDPTDFLDELTHFFLNLPDQWQSIEDKFNNMTEHVNSIVRTFDNKYLKMAFELFSCYIQSISSETIQREGIIETLKKYFGKTFSIYKIIKKLTKINFSLRSFIDNFSRPDVSDFEKYQVLGKSVASIIRVILKMNRILI